MFLDIEPDLLRMGMSASVVVARGVDNTRIPVELIAYRREAARRLGVHWKNRSISAHPAIREYHRLHEHFGAVGEPPAPEKLITYVRRNQDFTSSGAVVDCYNIVSAKTLLSIGAHDLAKLSTPITLRKCTEKDTFVPLGQTESQPLTGEYGYIDVQRRIICRLDVLQCEHSKATRESRDIVFFLQGNACLSSAVLLKGTWLLAEVIERFTGGKAEIVDFHDSGTNRTVASSKPPVTFDEFSALNLQKGTLIDAEQLPNMPSLSAATICVGDNAVALVPTSDLPKGSAGIQAVVATGLHPVRADGRLFTSYLMSGPGSNGQALLAIGGLIPDGSKLY
jgi:DNA/RNA-binding domain of Phe-tRNA-synthetase-like protein